MVHSSAEANPKSILTAKPPYEPKSGTICNSGLDYETKIVALLSLECLENDDKAMWLASNPKGIPGFDDIILHRLLGDDTTITYLLQLKHKDNEKTVTERDLLKQAGKKKSLPFYVIQYLKHSARLIEEIYNLGSQSEIIKHLREVQTIKFVLFTNSKVEECDFLENLTDDNINFLNTNNAGVIYKVLYNKMLDNNLLKENLEFEKHLNNIDFLDRLNLNCSGILKLASARKTHSQNSYLFETISSICNKYIGNESSAQKMHLYNNYFFDHFYLFSNQVHAQNADMLIHKKLYRILGSKRQAPWDFLEITKGYVAFIKAWAKGKLGGNYPLSETQISINVVALFLESRMVKFSNLFRYPPDSNFDIHTWGQMTSDISITIVNAQRGVYEFLNAFVSYKVREKLAKVNLGQSVLWDNKEFPLQSQELAKKMRKFIPEGEKSTLLGIYKFLWTEKHVPLVLEIESAQEYQNIVKALKLINFALSVILVKNTIEEIPANTEISHFLSLNDLNGDKIAMISNKIVNIQRRTSFHLEDIIGDDINPHISSTDVIDILSDNFNIGNIVPPVPYYVISRSFKQIYLNPEVLKELHEEVFSIKINVKTNCEKLKELTSKICFVNDIINNSLPDNCNIILTKEHLDSKQLKKIAGKRHVHQLEYHNNCKVEWKMTHGSIHSIRSYRIETEEEDSVYTDAVVDIHRESKLTILSDIPGMGKSTLIDQLAYRAPKEVWVLKIQLNRYMKYYKSDSCKTPETAAVEHLTFFNSEILANENCHTEVAQKLFLKMFLQKRVLVLLDGFDEVSYIYKREVTNIAAALLKGGCRIWITTRPHMTMHLEEYFNVMSLSLQPFTVEQQLEFLTKYFSGSDSDLRPDFQASINQFCKGLIRVAKKNLYDRDARFAGIPMQAMLLAEFFYDDCKDYISGVATSLSKKFDLLALYDNFIEKKINVLRDKFGDIAEDTYGMFKQHLCIFALHLLFPAVETETISHKLYNSFYKLNSRNYQMLQKIGIVSVDQDFKIVFIHRTIAEYLSAQWLFQNYNNNQNMSLKDVALLILSKKFVWKHNFLFNIFDRMVAQNCPLHLSIINGEFETALKIISSSPDCLHFVDDLNRTPLHTIAIYGYFNPSHTFSQRLISLNNDKNDVLENVIEQIMNHNNVLIEKSDVFGYNVLDYAIGNGFFSIAEKMCAAINTPTINLLVDFKSRQKYFRCCCMLGYKYLFRTFLKHFAFYDILYKKVRPLDDMGPYCLNNYYYPVRNDDGFNDYDISKYLKEFGLKKLSDIFPLDNQYYDDLHLASAFGSCSNLQLLIDKGVDVNKRDLALATPLHTAVRFQNYENVQLLLTNGAQINNQNVKGNTPLHDAIISNYYECVCMLVDNNGDVNISNKDNVTPLQLAMESKSSKINYLFQDYIALDESAAANDLAEFSVFNVFFGAEAMDILVNHASSVILYNKYPKTNNLRNLHNVVMDGDLSTLQHLLSSKTDLKAKDQDGNTVLHCAVRKRDLQIVKFLLSNYASADDESFSLYDNMSRQLIENIKSLKNYFRHQTININEKNLHQKTALHLAVEEAHEEMVKLLLDYGAKANIADGNCNSALHMAAARDLRKIASYLLAKGAKIDQQRAVGRCTPLHTAIRSNNVKMAKLLYLRGANVNILGFNHSTALHLAVEHGSKEITSWLLAAGANVNQKNGSCNTPLHISVGKGDVLIAKLLHAHGANLNVTDGNGNSVLHLAVISNLEKMIRWVLSVGFDIEHPNESGSTALQIAIVDNNIHVVKLLHSLSADINRVFNDGSTALHVAVKDDLEEMFNWLLSFNTDVDKQDAHGRTPLHIALEEGDLDVAQILVAHGADIHKTASDGTTALQLAAKSESKETVSWVLSVASDCSDPRNIAKMGSDNNTPLHTAAEYDLSELASLLAHSGWDINKQNLLNDTPLHLAVKNHNVEIAKLLLSLGALVNISGSKANYVLHHAVKPRNEELVGSLLSLGADANKVNEYGETPLHIAIRKTQINIAKILYAHGADATKTTLTKDTILHVAVMTGFKELVSWVLSLGVAVNQQNEANETSLHIAVREFHFEIASLLISNGGDVNAINSHGETVLHISSRSGYIQQVTAILPHVANLNQRDYRNNTPLHYTGNKKIAKLLQSQGADINALGFHGESLLHIAAKRDDTTFISWLLSFGIEVNKTNDEKITPLHIAVKEGNLEVAKLLHSRGATVNSTDCNGNGVLHYAAESGLFETIYWLLSIPVMINSQNKFGDTPLHIAVRQNHTEAVSLLLDEGADGDMLGRDGKTVFHIAAENPAIDSFCTLFQTIEVEDDSTKMATLLNSYGVDINIFDSNGDSILHRAIRNGSEQVVVWVLALGADVNRKNVKSQTPLHIAITEGRTDLVQLLHSHNADINILGSDKNTTLHYAAGSGSEKLIRWLSSLDVNIEKANCNGITPLQAAVQAGHANAAKLIHSLGGDIINVTYTGDTIMHFAAGAGSEETVSWLLALEVGLDRENNEGLTPLHIAAREGHVAIVKRLYSLGADIEKITNDGSTISHFAAESGSPDIISWLLSLSVDFSLANDVGETPLFIASSNNHVDATKFLLSHGVSINILHSNDKYLLQHALAHGFDEMVYVLLELGTDVYKENEEDTPLQFAIAAGQVDVAKLLYSYKADITRTTNSGWSVLHLAAQAGSKELILWLLSLGVDQNMQNCEGDTPLLVAIRAGHTEAAKLLHSRGSDISKCDFNGNSAMHKAVQFYTELIFVWLLVVGADIDKANALGDTPLHIAISKNLFKIAQVLVHYGAKVENVAHAGNTALHLSVENCSEEMIRWILSLGVGVNCQNEEGATPLHLAAKKNYLGAAILLLDSGADINIADNLGNATLHKAVKGAESQVHHTVRIFPKDNSKGFFDSFLDPINFFDGDDYSNSDFNVEEIKHSTQIVSRVIELGANINEQNGDGDTPIHIAVRAGHMHTAKLLHWNDANVHLLGLDGNSLLHSAAYSASEDTMCWLLSLGIDVNITNKLGDAPLHIALLRGDLQIAQLLISHGADINMSGYNGNFPLHYAVGSGSQEMVSWIVSMGVNVNDQNESRDTALHLAVANGNLRMAELLHSHNANVNASGRDEDSILHTAILVGFMDTITWLLSLDINVNKINRCEEPPLFYALAKNHVDIAKLLHSRGADINITDHHGDTGLHCAAESGYMEGVSWMLSVGSDVNKENAYGDTPLNLAMASDNVDVGKVLYANGADITIVDFAGDSALHCAADIGSQESLSWLLSLNVDINKGNLCGYTPLHLAVASNHIDAAKLLHAHGADVNVVDAEGDSALHCAAECGFHELISWLASVGANVNERNNSNYTPLNYAPFNRDDLAVALLLSLGANLPVENENCSHDTIDEINSGI